jgi:hypothetical protein
MTESNLHKTFQKKYRHDLSRLERIDCFTPKRFKNICFYWFVQGTLYKQGCLIKNKNWRKEQDEKQG